MSARDEGRMGQVPGMISPSEAVALMLAVVRPVDCERAEIGGAAGRVLGDDLCADRDGPACDVSAMDGFAVRAEEAGARSLEIGGDVFIGRAPPPLPRGGAVRIVTGGAVPAGADAVVKREDVEEREGAIRVREGLVVKAGAHVRRRGENIRAGGVVAQAGAVIGPGLVGALASCGVATLRVRRRVRVGVLTTGDELVGIEQEPTAWQLRDSNGPALAALLGGRAWLDVLPARHAADSPEELATEVGALMGTCDAVFVTGGVSMGVRDFVPGALESAGARVEFHKVNQRPGKPLLGAVGPRGQVVLALPGNPVSALVCARRVGLPILAALGGAAGLVAPPERAMVMEPDEKTLGMWWHRLVMRDGVGSVRLVGHASSGDVPGAARAAGFVEVPPGEGGAGPWDFYSWT